MRCVIMISENPEKYVSCSTEQKVPGGKRISFTSDMNEAEEWVDPKAAKAWCESHDYGDAIILQIDAPVRVKPTEVRRLDPKGHALSNAEKTALRVAQEVKEAAEAEAEADDEEEEAPVVVKKTKKAPAKKKLTPKGKPGKKAPLPVTDEERALAAMESTESHALSGHDD